MKQAIILHLNQLRTPAFIVDEEQIDLNIDQALEAIGRSDTRLLFALKSFSTMAGLERIARSVQGLHASSLFEARLARELMGSRGIVHLTTPALRTDEFDEITHICDYISFNSFTQWVRYRDFLRIGTAYGLRVNPQLSFVQDCRYNPCRKHSKLGVPLRQMTEQFRRYPESLAGISGLLIHTNCDAQDFTPLLETVRHLENSLGAVLKQIEWINLGGGYLFDKIEDVSPLREAIDLLESYDLEVMFEPGSAIIRTAGYLVTEVTDVFESDGAKIAVLDTSVNHMPEVFEYQFEPDIYDSTPDGAHSYVLSGATCLAGDLFGEYAFDIPLQVGSRVVFENMGSYTLVKSNMFNGINLPSIYALEDGNKLTIKQQFGYEDFVSRCGGKT